VSDHRDGPVSYYHWLASAASRAAGVACDVALAERIRAVSTTSDGAYGAPRVTAEPRETGAPVNPVPGFQGPCWCFGRAGAVSRIL
jgi:hypothetical protein